MLCAILSDIHSNLEALDVVLNKCKELKVDKYFCLGDIVGYNADPSECIRRIRALNNCSNVKGNHDELIGSEIIPSFNINAYAQASIAWSIGQLSQDEKDWLISNPLKIEDEESKITIVHSGLITPERWPYIFDLEDAILNMAEQETFLCFFGHTHVPVIYERSPNLLSIGSKVSEIKLHYGISEEDEEIRISLSSRRKYLINPGSIGQPRNQDSRTSFIIYDTKNRLIRHFLLNYDIGATQKKILDAGLPEHLARRLEFGR